MRYKVVCIPVLDTLHLTVTEYDDSFSGVPIAKHTWIMGEDDGELDRIWSSLSWLAGEIAGSAG